MERTMQWWDEADDLWFALRLRLLPLAGMTAGLRRSFVPLCIGLFLLLPAAQAA
jgi:hypothetical protein